MTAAIVTDLYQTLIAGPGTARITRCRYLRRGVAGQCTAEALDDTAEVLLCAKHTAAVMRMINERTAP